MTVAFSAQNYSKYNPVTKHQIQSSGEYIYFAQFMVHTHTKR